MTISSEDELQKLRAAGRVVAQTLAAMGEAIEPGITTRELDGLGRRLLEAEGARFERRSSPMAFPAPRASPSARMWRMVSPETPVSRRAI
jgi:methionine aminopeptidase